MNTALETNTALELLPWDTDLMGFPVARLQPAGTTLSCVAAVLAQARSQQIQLLYWFVDPADAQAEATARAIGGRLADHKVTYVMPIDAAPDSESLSKGIEPVTQMTSELHSLALQSGICSRFRTDPGFAAGVYEQLYMRWIENSVAGILAREVLVFRPEPGVPETGMLTLSAEFDRVSIGLLAVDELARGKAVGTQLIRAAQQRTRAWGLAKLQVVTQQENEKACRFYEQRGFTAERVQNIYHIWMK